MYSNNRYDEYPHTLKVVRSETVIDKTVYPWKETIKESEHTIQGFMDTPTSSQQINYHNLNITLDRVLYIPFGADITRSDVFFYGDVKYKFKGDLQDQGGQNEVLSAPVERV